MKIFVPSPLRSYTAGASSVEGRGATLDAILLDLDRTFPGFRFRIIDEQDRIRPHIKIFVNASQQIVVDRTVNSTDEIHIVCALSGGCGGDGNLRETPKHDATGNWSEQR